MGSRLKFVVFVGGVCALALRGQINEYQVKAMFLYNFARYVEWPPQSFRAPGDPIVICILGQSPFGNSLDQAIAGKAIDWRTFVAREIADVQPGGCQILFVTAAEKKRFRAAALRIRGSGILTVGETQGFTGDGGVLNFKLDDGKLHFEIDLNAAAREHLHISSKLLSLAQIVKN